MDHRLDAIKIPSRSGSAVSVVLASSGYPGSFEKGKLITINEDEIPEGEVSELANLQQNSNDTSWALAYSF